MRRIHNRTGEIVPSIITKPYTRIHDARGSDVLDRSPMHFTTFVWRGNRPVFLSNTQHPAPRQRLPVKEGHGGKFRGLVNHFVWDRGKV